MKEFSHLGLKREVLSALRSGGYHKPLEMQEKIIPLLLKGDNVVFTSRTGSGKTLAYSAPFLGKLNRKRGLQMIVLVPTRELCVQVGKEIERLAGPLELKVGVLFGGRDISGDYRTITRKNQVIVATPGRFIDHVNLKQVRVGEVRFLIYDEADQMFDSGFFNECAYIRSRISKDAQIVLASATMTPKVKDFVTEIIGKHELLQVGEQISSAIIQEVHHCPKDKKNDTLIRLMEEKSFQRVLVFCNTKAKCRGIKELLDYNNIKSSIISGDLEQKERQEHLNLFKDGRLRVLVATDVAARGLHIEKVDLVVNYDVPSRPEFYVHRIGRTGRVGKEGKAITFICPEDEERFLQIQTTFSIKADKWKG